jgi:urease accessory protein UreH
MVAEIESAALFIQVLDPVVCYQDADYFQQQVYNIHDGSAIVLDWFTSGRKVF